MSRTHEPAGGSAATPAGVQVEVDDMTCGHCAARISSAIESSVPGARAVADPGTRLVSVEGADYATVSGIIAEAGYTPAPRRA